MGCGCKQNTRQTKTKVINNETIIEPEPMTLETLIGDSQPPFTRQEVQRAQDFLNGITNSYQEKIYLYEFHNKYHRETLQPSCSVCLPRITDRINQMAKILNDYDKKSL
jgi:hypothetical protein